MCPKERYRYSRTNPVSPFPLSKFSPPRFNPDQHLLRSRIISRLVNESVSVGKTIVIEGQAGQGKSLLAAQYLNNVESPFAWFHIDQGDADPVTLLLKILKGLSIALSDFVSQDLETWIAQGSTLPPDVSQLSEILVRDLEKYLPENFYLVFDDLHLIDSHQTSLQLVASLLTSSRTNLRLLLISRFPVFTLLSIALDAIAVDIIKDEDTALNRQEIAELFNAYFQLPVNPSTVNSLYLSTEGWIMGLILAAQGNVNQSDHLPLFSFSAMESDQQNFENYFSKHVLARIPEKYQDDLIKLSLLDEIPAELAPIVTKGDDVPELLRDLENKNFFVRSLGENGSTFSFHHLFQECLRRVVDEQKGQAYCCEVWNTAGHWYRDLLPETALSYFLRADNFTESQAILESVGMQLLASNRIVSLQKYLSQIPDEVFKNFHWLSFYNAVVCLNTLPPSALTYLEQAREGFITEKNEVGELFTLVQLIYFHAAIDCQFSRGQELLGRAIRLFKAHGQQLDDSQQAHASNLFVVGLTFFSAELKLAREFTDFGLVTAQKLGLKELEAEARMARCYHALFVGDLHACQKEMEHSLSLIRHPQVSLLRKATLQLGQLNLLVNQGDLPGYKYRREIYRKTYGEELIDQSSFGAIMRMWEIDLCLACGDEIKMAESLEAALASDFGKSFPHMRSLYLQYHGYLLARKGQEEEALGALEESLELRLLSGGKEFLIMNHVFHGGTYIRLGRLEKGLEFLNEGIKISESAGEYFVRSGLYSFRAWAYLKRKDIEKATDDLRQMFSVFRESGFCSYYGWDPEIMTDLLIASVRAGVEPELAMELASSRLGIVISKSGLHQPLVKIKSFGGIEIHYGTDHLLNSDLSPSMRQLLAMLIAEKRHELDQEFVQNALWPEDSHARGRANFDTLVSRTRKLLSSTFSGCNGKEVLSLKKQILSLKHCWIDVDEFRRLINVGLSLSRSQKVWQAENTLRQGLALWQGDFLGGRYSQVDLWQAPGDVHFLFLEGSSEYSRLLVAQGQLTEAEQVLKKALNSEPTNETLVKKLYELHVQQGSPKKVHQVFKAYEESLKRADYSPEDISFLLESFWD